MKPVRVLFLGTGDAFSAGGRNQSAYLVQGSECSFLIDCGATVLTSLKRHNLSAGGIDTIFISHLHGDHFAGLPFLFLEYITIKPRKRPLRIVGPPGTKDHCRALLEVTCVSTAREPLPFVVEFIELEPGKPTLVGTVAVEPFLTPHQKNALSLGLRISVEGRTILYSGDTGWTENLVTYSQGADLFICECSFYDTRMESHLDYGRLAENRHRFGAKRLVLTHLGSEVLARLAEIDMETASDGLIIEI